MFYGKKSVIIALSILFFTISSPIWAQFFTGDGGRGKSIAILSPRASGLSEEQQYIPELVQGELVSNFSTYSAIKVLDRVSLDKQYAELLSGYYSEDAGMDLGHLVPTDYLMVGTITRTSSGFALQIQITRDSDKTTVASYSQTVSFSDLDNLTGIRRASLDLLQKLDVRSTEQAKAELTRAVSTNHVNAQTAIAHGVVAERRGNVVEALSFYEFANSSDRSLTESSLRATQVLSVSVPVSVRERVQWGQEQISKWNKIFSDLETYMKDSILLAIIFDLDNGGYIYSNLDLTRQRIDIRINGQGIKFVPNRTALLVFERINRQWDEIKKAEDNRIWTDSVRGRFMGSTEIRFNFSANVELLDEDNVRISYLNFSSNNERFDRFSLNNSNFPLLTNERYYTNSNFTPLVYNNQNPNRISDKLSVKIMNVRWNNDEIKPLHVFNISEWQRWLSQNQGSDQQGLTSANAAAANVAITAEERERAAAAEAARAREAAERARKTAIENLTKEYMEKMFSYQNYFGREMPSNGITNAITAFAPVRSRNDIIALFDDTYLKGNTGKAGCAFTLEGVYFKFTALFGLLEEKGYIKYADIENVQVTKERRRRSDNQYYDWEGLIIRMRNVSNPIEITSTNFNRELFRDFLIKARDASK
jgi:TolB-like protein